jgi:hypothetical protein
MSDDRQRWDNNDWHEGMTLPSRKDKHKSRSKKKAKQSEPKPETRATEPVVKEERATEPLERESSDSLTASAEDMAVDHPALQEIEQARAEATAASAVGMTEPDVTWAERQALLDDRAHQEKAAGDDVDPPPFFSTWQRVLLWTGTVLVTLFVLAWGKLGYVHNVPDLVRSNVPAYDSGPAFLVLKPWWFGPPVLDLAQYNRETETPNWDLYHARLGDYAGIVDNPHVLWYFQEDILP